MQFDNSIEVITPDLTNILTIGGKALEIPYGDTANRPSEAIPGAIRYNTSLGQIEIRGVTVWEPIPSSLTLSSTNITTALGFTPYNATNPSGYQTAAQVSSAIAAVSYTLPTATTSVLGGVKLDGITITTNGSGQIQSIITSSQVTTALGYTPLSDQGGTLTGSIDLPKTSGTGIKVDGGYGWRDLVGNVIPRATGLNAPTLKNYIGTIRLFSYAAGDIGDITFHMPHDYVPGTDLFIHVHWGHNGTAITGTFQVDFNVSYAKGFGQASFATPVNPSLVVSSLNITNSPQYVHRVDEIQLSTAGGSSTQLNSNNLEVDGLVLLTYTATTIPSISGGASTTPFIMSIDIHYQSTSLATKNKAPNFYA